MRTNTYTQQYTKPNLPPIRHLINIADGRDDFHGSRSQEAGQFTDQIVFTPTESEAASWGSSSSSSSSCEQSPSIFAAQTSESQTRRSSLASYSSHPDSVGSGQSTNTEWSVHSSDGHNAYNVDVCGRTFSSLNISDASNIGNTFPIRPAKRRAPDSDKTVSACPTDRSTESPSPGQQQKDTKTKKLQHSNNERDRRKVQNIQTIFLLGPDIPKFVKPVTEKVADSSTNKGLPAKTVALERAYLYLEGCRRTVDMWIEKGLISEDAWTSDLRNNCHEAAVQLPHKMKDLWDNYDNLPVPENDWLTDSETSNPRAKRSKGAAKSPKPCPTNVQNLRRGVRA